MKLLDIQAEFDRVARDYERHDALEREVGERLLERVRFARIPVSRALDLGSGPGRAAAAIVERFDSAGVVAVDVSHGMLSMLRARFDGNCPVSTTVGDLARLPLAASCADLVYSNLALQWVDDFEQALNEIRRVLVPGGMLLFSVPGPGSLRELRVMPNSGQSGQMPIYMPDLQELGDLLVAAGFSEPVMDSETITLSYSSEEAMIRELNVTGGAGFMEVSAEHTRGAGVELKIEVVYGTAFGPPEGQPIRSGQGEIATFSVDQLRRKK